MAEGSQSSSGGEPHISVKGVVGEHRRRHSGQIKRAVAAATDGGTALVGVANLCGCPSRPRWDGD